MTALPGRRAGNERRSGTTEGGREWESGGWRDSVNLRVLSALPYEAFFELRSFSGGGSVVWSPWFFV